MNSLLFLQEIDGSLDDALCIHTVMVEDLLVVTMYGVLIRDTDDPHGHGVLRECLGYHGTQTAKHTVFLNGDDTLGVTGSLQDSLFVERLDP